MLNPFIFYLWAAACERNTIPSGSCKLCRREVGVRGEHSVAARMLKSKVLQAHVEGEHDENKYVFSTLWLSWALIFGQIPMTGTIPPRYCRSCFPSPWGCRESVFPPAKKFSFPLATPAEEQVRLVNSYPQLSLLWFIMVPNKHQ